MVRFKYTSNKIRTKISCNSFGHLKSRFYFCVKYKNKKVDEKENKIET